MDGCDGEALRIGAGQYGVVARRQLLASGVTPRQVDRLTREGTLIRVLPQTFLVAGAPQSWKQELMAAALWAGEDALVSHQSAAFLHGFLEDEPGST